MRQTLFLLAISVLVASTALSQTMLESGAVIAGSTVGGVAGKSVSGGINKSLKKSGSILDTGAKSGEKPSDKKDKELSAAPSTPTPMLKVSAGVPKAELNNVPPPPPPV